MADVDTRTTFVMVRIEVFVCCLLVRILHTRGKYPRALERIAHYRTYVRGERGEVQALNTHDCIDFLRPKRKILVLALSSTSSQGCAQLP